MASDFAVFKTMGTQASDELNGSLAHITYTKTPNTPRLANAVPAEPFGVAFMSLVASELHFKACRSSKWLLDTTSCGWPEPQWP